MTVLVLASVLVLSGDTLLTEKRAHAFEDSLQRLYDDCAVSATLDYKVFRLALIGYYNMSREGRVTQPATITIIDYEKRSTQKRLYVIDLEQRSLQYNALVAHGKHTGLNQARDFSNDPKSKMSSLGFYVTAGTYYGRHGYSLVLHGVEPDYNGNAAKRSIVMHGADYVSTAFIRKYGRLGRSWGCPAVPRELHRSIIDEIKNGACLFMYYGDESYLEKSPYLKLATAVDAYWRGTSRRIDDTGSE